MLRLSLVHSMLISLLLLRGSRSCAPLLQSSTSSTTTTGRILATSLRLSMSTSTSSNEQIGSPAVRLVSPAKKERVGKVVMLHGWAQNAWIFQSKTKGLTKKLNQAGYDCVFLEGPHVLPMTSTVDVEGTPVQVENGTRENARAWFLLCKEDPADASLSQSETPMEYIGVDESLKLIQEELERNDYEYCAILGFSQGGVFAHILSVLAMQSNNYNDNIFGRIKCAVIASGFAAEHVSNDRSPFQVGNLSTTRVTLPSLHLIGELDVSVRPELSLKLVDMFEDAQVLKHDKGHLLPQKSAQSAELIAFLESHRTSAH